MSLSKPVGLMLVVMALAAGTAQSQETEMPPQRYALLIAVNNYTHLQDLQYCDNDMSSLREACVKVGFPESNVTLMHDGAQRPELMPFRNNVLEQLRILLGGVRQNDLVVVAFSGHGVHLGEADYFCTMDTKLEDPDSTMVPVEEVTRMLKESKAQQKLLIVDACRNDPLPDGTRSATDNSLVTSFQRSIARQDKASKGIVVMASCAENQVSVEDPDLQHGVFMNYVVNGLLGHADRDRNKEVTLLELHMYAEYETRNYVRNTRSMLQTPNLRGDVTGNYVLASVSERPLSLDLQPVATTASSKPGAGPSAIELKLYDAAYGLLQQGKTAEAIREFEQLVGVADNEQIKRIARLKLASAYLSLDPIKNIGKALEIHKQAGMDAVSLVVRNDSANIKSGDNVRGTVKKDQVVSISEAKGDWYRVKAVDGNTLADDKVGFLYKTAFQKAPAKTQTTSSSNQVVNNQNYGYGNDYGYGYGYGGNGGGFGGQGGGGFGDYAGVDPRDRAAVKDLDRNYNELDRMERRGASNLEMFMKEREIMRKEQELDRKQMQREAIRNFFRGGR